MAAEVATATRPDAGSTVVGVRLGLLFGPSVFGVTAAGVALSDVAGDLHVQAATATWVLTAHALALGLGTAVFGRLADTLGVRRTLAVGALFLAAGTVVAVLAPGLWVLVAGRFVLAAGSGAMTASALAVIASRPPAERPHVLATFGAGMAVFAASATLAGGVVTGLLSWRVTLVLPALSLAAIPLCLRLAPPAGRSSAPHDPVGAALLVVAAGALLLLIQSPALALPAAVAWTLAALLAVAGVALAAWTHRRPAGFVLRGVIAERTFGVAAVAGAGVYGGLFATVFLVPQLLVERYGLSTLLVGLALLPGSAVGAALSRVAGRISGVGASVVLGGIAAATAAAMVATGLSGWGGPALVATTTLAFAAFAVAQVVTTARLSARLAPDRRGSALGLLNLAFLLVGAVGSATAGALEGALGLGPTLAVVAVFPAVAVPAAVGLGHLARRAE